MSDYCPILPVGRTQQKYNSCLIWIDPKIPDLLWFLSLFTISVILQPLLSKFSFLINLVSRNGSFFSSLDLRFLTNLPAFQLNFSWSLPLPPWFSWPHSFSYIYIYTCIKRAPEFVQRFTRADEMDFTNWPFVSTIILPVLWQCHSPSLPFRLFCFLWVMLICIIIFRIFPPL